jgi:arabinofuranosyltransferase
MGIANVFVITRGLEVSAHLAPSRAETARAKRYWVRLVLTRARLTAPRRSAEIPAVAATGMTRTSRLAWALPAVALATLLVVLVGTAWQSDDAFITFRTVRNAWHGHGLTWNPGERVQAYTHPAWMLLSLLCYGATRECYYSVLVAAIALALGTGVVLWRATRPSHLLGAAAVFVLGTAIATADYAVSGLENPLLFLLLAVFAVVLARPPGPRRVLRLTLLAAAIGLTRLDALLLVGPALLLVVVDARRRGERPLAPLALGLAPLVAWEGFTLVYYGALVPNPALAKLKLDVPATALLGHGLEYLLDSIVTDPISLVTIVAGSVLLVARGDRCGRALVVGLALYLLYLLRIGGDFMSGRFLGAPLVLVLAAALPVLAARIGPRAQALVLAVALVYGAAWPRSRLRVDPDYGSGAAPLAAVRPSGIADERAYYYPRTGLLAVLSARRAIARAGLPVPPSLGALHGQAFAASPQPISMGDEIGFFGYFADQKLIVDRWALADPFLARIPFRADGRFRVGHYRRTPPPGYLESRVAGRNLVTDPALHARYDDVQRVTTGPLFAGARWRAIWRLHLGLW